MRPVAEQVATLTATSDQLQKELDQLQRAVSLLIISVALVAFIILMERRQLARIAALGAP